MEFEWDGVKSLGNKIKHGISFEEVEERIGEGGHIATLPNPNPKYQGQLLLLFTTMDGREWTAAVEPRGKNLRIITCQQRRKYRSKK